MAEQPRVDLSSLAMSLRDLLLTTAMGGSSTRLAEHLQQAEREVAAQLEVLAQADCPAHYAGWAE